MNNAETMEWEGIDLKYTQKLMGTFTPRRNLHLVDKTVPKLNFPISIFSFQESHGLIKEEDGASIGSLNSTDLCGTGCVKWSISLPLSGHPVFEVPTPKVSQKWGERVLFWGVIL